MVDEPPPDFFQPQMQTRRLGDVDPLPMKKFKVMGTVVSASSRYLCRLNTKLVHGGFCLPLQWDVHKLRGAVATRSSRKGAAGA